jgi:taurine--2-oxoglutarate transaminase
MAPYNSKTEPMNKLAARFRELGLFTFVRWGSFMCNPPLVISDDELAQAFAIIDEALEVTHPYFEG